MEELQARHRKEQRELQGKITQKKKNASKKTRKGVNDECEALERELKERHQAEIDALDPVEVGEAIRGLDLDDNDERRQPSNGDAVAAKQVPLATNAKEEPEGSLTQQQAKRPNRQKARLARRVAEQEAQAAAAAQEAATLPDLREQEICAMKKEMGKRGLVEVFIQPDGHCLYSACAHSLDAAVVSESGPYSKPYQNVRFVTAQFIANHPEDFAPFLDEPLDTYVKKIKDTAEWGGQLELQAIAKGYNVNIYVLQADDRVEEIGRDESAAGRQGQDVWLAYYRHSYGLGEHYNALRKADKT